MDPLRPLSKHEARISVYSGHTISCLDCNQNRFIMLKVNDRDQFLYKGIIPGALKFPPHVLGSTRAIPNLSSDCVLGRMQYIVPKFFAKLFANPISQYNNRRKKYQEKSLIKQIQYKNRECLNRLHHKIWRKIQVSLTPPQ
jgi:hypothetical protein